MEKSLAVRWSELADYRLSVAGGRCTERYKKKS